MHNLCSFIDTSTDYSDPCTEFNCTHFCVPVPEGVSCICPSGRSNQAETDDPCTQGM